MIDGIDRGEFACPPRIAGRPDAPRGDLRGRPRDAQRERLTAREHEIAEMVSEGLSNKEIALKLCLELPTVKTHVHKILDKLQVRNRTDAANALRTDAAKSSPSDLVPRDPLPPTQRTMAFQRLVLDSTL